MQWNRTRVDIADIEAVRHVETIGDDLQVHALFMGISLAIRKSIWKT